MYKGNSLFHVIVRMSIDVSLVSVSCPPSVANANLMIVPSFALKLHSLDAITTKSIAGCEFRSDKLPLLINRYDTARVISTRF